MTNSSPVVKDDSNPSLKDQSADFQTPNTNNSPQKEDNSDHAGNQGQTEAT